MYAEARRSSGSAESERAHLYEHVLSRLGADPDAGVERRLVVHASKSVVHRYLELRKLDRSDEAYQRALLRLVTEMRKDLGHRDGLPVGDEVVELLSQSPGAAVETPSEPAPEPRSGEFRVMP